MVRIICLILGHDDFSHAQGWNRLTNFLSEYRTCKRCNKTRKFEEVKIWKEQTNDNKE